MTDWDSIKAAYLEGKQSLREIAQAHGISHPAIRWKAAKEGWPVRPTEKPGKLPKAKDLRKRLESVAKRKAESTPKKVRRAKGEPIVGIDPIKLRHEAFAREYVKNGRNGGKAYRTAINPEVTADVAVSGASTLLTYPNVIEMIERFEAEIAERVGLETETILREAVRISLADIRKLFHDDGSLLPMKDWPTDTAAAVASIAINPKTGVRITFWDKNQALANLMKHKGLFELDNLQRSGVDQLDRDTKKQLIQWLRDVESGTARSDTATSEG